MQSDKRQLFMWCVGFKLLYSYITFIWMMSSGRDRVFFTFICVSSQTPSISLSCLFQLRCFKCQQAIYFASRDCLSFPEYYKTQQSSGHSTCWPINALSYVTVDHVSDWLCLVSMILIYFCNSISCYLQGVHIVVELY